ncbi:MAG TPA: type II toxin-antitoxin system RelE/ParE family toxin [Mucilaginibacter sp.]
MSFKVSVSPNFGRELKRLAKKYPSIKADLSELVNSLIESPFQGNSLGRDCYKVRMRISSKGKGKSGGSRVITCVKIIKEQIFLLSIYDKSEQSDISDVTLVQILTENGLL